MKIEIQSKKGLRTVISIFVEKKIVEKKLNERLLELQSEVSLKGFRPGKVPASVIKNQYGKAVYGEVVDKLLKDSSSKALEEKNIKAVGQPKIDLKTFGEGKDLSYTLEVDSLPEIKLSPFEKYKSKEYIISIDKKKIEDKVNEIAKNHKNFDEKKEEEKSIKGDLVIFDYNATVDGKTFEGSEGKGVQLELGKDLFLKGFDDQLIGLKKNDRKTIEATLPENHPKKELANKKTKFECKIQTLKKPTKTKIDDEFAKSVGAKDLVDLKNLIEKQISSQYKQALDNITKKDILDQIEKLHDFDLPKNLVENELATMTQTLKKEEIDKHKTNNEKLARSRIKLGLVLNAYGENNKIKVEDNEINTEIQKQIKGMPGQEKMVLEYYQKNPSASQSLKGAIYEEKIITLLKTNIKLKSEKLSISEAEKMLSEFNESNSKQSKSKDEKPSKKTKSKTKK